MANPQITMQVYVHPKAVMVDSNERLISVRLDLNAPTESEGAYARPLNLALVIDKSGSMAGQKIETAKVAAQRVVDQMADNDTFTLVAFSSDAEVLVPACKIGKQRNEIAARISRLNSETSTLLAKGMRAAAEQMRPHCQPGVSSSMFILTDGQAQDQEECLNLAPGIVQGGMSIYAGGIGDGYDHLFLAKLCADPFEQGKFLVDHIDLSTLGKMDTVLESYLKRKGHVVTSNVRLFVTLPHQVNLKSIQAEEHGQAIQLDGQKSFVVADLCAGKRQRYLFEFVITPSAAGNMQLAHFRLRYDIPTSNVYQAEAETVAMLEITGDPSRAYIPNSAVVELVKKLQAITQMTKVEGDVLKGNVRGATNKLERVTRLLREVGENDKADEVQRLSATLQNQKDQDRLVKIVRGTTKIITE
jgi:Ca-activated chloride channel family protein